MDIVPPERFPELTAALLPTSTARPRSRKIIGGNMLRVAEQTWTAGGA